MQLASNRPEVALAPSQGQSSAKPVRTCIHECVPPHQKRALVGTCMRGLQVQVFPVALVGERLIECDDAVSDMMIPFEKGGAGAASRRHDDTV